MLIFQSRPSTSFAAVIGCVVLLTAFGGCHQGGEAPFLNGIRQTGSPGVYTAGGGTSGRVIARHAAATGNTTTAPAPVTATQAPQEGMRGQAAEGSVAGTPGIPEGAGGTTSGTEMGGTTRSAAATKAAPAPGGSAPTVPANESSH